MEEIEKVKKTIDELNLKSILEKDDLSIIKYPHPGPEFTLIHKNKNVKIFRNPNTCSTKFLFLS